MSTLSSLLSQNPVNTVSSLPPPVASSSARSSALPLRTAARASVPGSLAGQSSRSSARNIRLVGAFRARNPLRIRSIRGSGSATRLRQSQVGGLWEFFSNRLFRFTPRGIGTVVRSDLFPVVGRYRLSRGSITVSGQRQSSFGLGGGATVFVDGVFTRGRNGQIAARIVQSTTSSSAFVGIGGPISGGSSNTYDFTIRMARIVGRLLR